MKLFNIKIIVLVMCLAVLSQSVFAATEIRIKKNANVADHKITLGDIAIIQCDDIELRDRLMQMVVGHIAVSGDGKALSIKSIAGALKATGISPFSVDLYGASLCQVIVSDDVDPLFTANKAPEPLGTSLEQAVGEIIPEEVFTLPSKLELMAVIEKTISQDTGQPILTIEDEIKRRVVIETGFPIDRLEFNWHDYNRDFLRVPLEPNRYRFDATHTVDIGRVSFKITDLKATRKRAKTITANVFYLCESVIAKHDLIKNDVITESNVEMKLQKVSNRRHIGINDLSLVLNQQVRSKIHAGGPVVFTKIKRIDLVHRNDYVKVSYTVGNIKMHSSGIALDTGAYGDMILVKDTYNQKQKYFARVDAQGEVVVPNGQLSSEPIALKEAGTRRNY